MIRATVYITVLLLVSSTLNSLRAEETVWISLRVEISELTSDEGQIRISLFNSEEDWMSTPFNELEIDSEEGAALAVIEQIPRGDYAANFYQDPNGNGQLDTGFMRIPTEPYGFSRQASAAFGPPNWESAKIRIDGGNRLLTLRPQ